MASSPTLRRALLALVGIGALALVAVRVVSEVTDGEERGGDGAVPVEVASIESGTIAERRTFSGALSAPGELHLAPRISGRIERLHVDLGDTVARGQLVAELDRAAFEQAHRAARAELAVAEAELARAESALQHATQQFDRAALLFERGSSSQAELDEARMRRDGAAAEREVAKAGVARAGAAAEAARIELGYTRLVAEWTGGKDTRVVARRHFREGETAPAHEPLLSLVELDPLVAEVFVTEADYARIQVGREVVVRADAFPDTEFTGVVARIAPAFDEASRQARVELEVDNADHRLKPGMYVEASVVLDEVDDARIVPAEALTRRGDRDGVFVLDEDAGTVHWHAVETGLREGDRVQIVAPALDGRVVTIGVHQLGDGVAVTLPAPAGEPSEDTPAERAPDG